MSQFAKANRILLGKFEARSTKSLPAIAALKRWQAGETISKF